MRLQFTQTVSERGRCMSVTGRTVRVRYSFTETDVADRDYVRAPSTKRVCPIPRDAAWTAIAVVVAVVLAALSTAAGIVIVAATCAHDLSGVLDFALYGRERISDD